VVPENIPSHPMDGHWKFQGGGGLKAKILKGKYEVKPEFPEGWGRGVQSKKPFMREVWIFSGIIHYFII